MPLTFDNPQTLANLLRATEAAHKASGDNGDWPEWYAKYMMSTASCCHRANPRELRKGIPQRLATASFGD